MEWFRRVDHSDLTAYDSLGFMRVKDMLLAYGHTVEFLDEPWLQDRTVLCSQRLLDDLHGESFWLYDQMMEDGALVYYLLTTCGSPHHLLHVVLAAGLRTHTHLLVRLQQLLRRAQAGARMRRRLAAVRGLRARLPGDIVADILMRVS